MAVAAHDRPLRQPLPNTPLPSASHGSSETASAFLGTYGHVMARYAVDASTLLHLVDNELRIDHSVQFVAPGSIRSQAMQLLLRDVIDGRRTEEAALQTHERITELKMRLLADRVSRRTAWQIARQHGWDTLRDAEYLAITKLQADALVTVDAGLAAKAHGIVPVAALHVLLAG